MGRSLRSFSIALLTSQYRRCPFRDLLGFTPPFATSTSHPAASTAPFSTSALNERQQKFKEKLLKKLRFREATDAKTMQQSEGGREEFGKNHRSENESTEFSKNQPGVEESKVFIKKQQGEEESKEFSIKLRGAEGSEEFSQKQLNEEGLREFSKNGQSREEMKEFSKNQWVEEESKDFTKKWWSEEGAKEFSRNLRDEEGDKEFSQKQWSENGSREFSKKQQNEKDSNEFSKKQWGEKESDKFSKKHWGREGQKEFSKERLSEEGSRGFSEKQWGEQGGFKEFKREVEHKEMIKLKKPRRTFEDLGLSEELMAAVRELNLSVPTEIQRRGIPAVLDQNHVVLGSHTGSGKTLAYLLPIFQRMREDEVLRGTFMRPKNPRAVVLCPTRELTEQVFRVAKSVSHIAKFRVRMIGGGDSRWSLQNNTLNEPVDMVVGTPGRVLEHVRRDNLHYSGLKYLVLDEADTLFDDTFANDIREFIHPLKYRASVKKDDGYQVVLASATITKPVKMLFDEEFEGIKQIHTSTMHMRVETARHDFLKVKGRESKMDRLLQVLEPLLKKKQQVMVFCNTLNSSRAVDHFLVENNINSSNYHGGVRPLQRVENLNKFKDEIANCHTLVCSDLAARGLDLRVDHVIMFDFPHNSVDYILRSGRTARNGARGRITSLVSRRELPLAKRIQSAIKKNMPIESVSVDDLKRERLRQQVDLETMRSANFWVNKSIARKRKEGEHHKIKQLKFTHHVPKLLPWLSQKREPHPKATKLEAPTRKRIPPRSMGQRSLPDYGSQSRG